MSAKKSVAKPKEPAKKVYCGECKHLLIHTYFPLPSECQSLNNFSDSWIGPNSRRRFHPSDKNANNDCDWFEQKPAESEASRIAIHDATDKTSVQVKRYSPRLIERIRQLFCVGTR